MTKWVVLILLFITPFVVLPFGMSQFETPKVIASEIGVEILIVIAFLKSGTLGKFSNKFFIPLGIIFFISIFDLVFFKTDTAFFGNPFRLQGIFLLWHLIGFSLVSSHISIDKTPIKFFIFILILLLCSIFVFGNNNAGRAIGSLGEPNFLAANALFVWPFILSSSSPERRSWKILFGSLVVVCAILFLTKSHSAMIGFFVQIVFLTFVNLLRIQVKTGLIVCIILLLSALFLPFVVVRDPYEDRATIWQLSTQAIIKSPMLGFGFGNGEKVLKNEIVEKKTRLVGYYVDSPHNFLLDYFLSGGVVGFLTIVFLIYFSFKNFVAHKNLKNITLLLGILAPMLFNPSGVTTLLAFWWLIGQGMKTRSSVSSSLPQPHLPQ